MVDRRDRLTERERQELEALLRRHEAILWSSPELGNMPFLANPLQVGEGREEKADNPPAALAASSPGIACSDAKNTV